MRKYLLSCLVVALALAACSSPSRRARQRSDSFRRLSAEDKKLVLRGRVREGMSRDATYIAWGRPTICEASDAGKSSRETWIYRRQITVYAPINSYSQSNVFGGFYGPGFSDGLPVAYRYGQGLELSGFYAPNTYVTAVPSRRAMFAEDRLIAFEGPGVHNPVSCETKKACAVKTSRHRRRHRHRHLAA